MAETIFHKIINKEIPSEILHEDSQCIAIKDINPVSPTHLLVIPKKTIVNLADSKDEDEALLGHLMRVAAKLMEGSSSGYRIVINNGEDVGQTVFQLHIHVLAGREFSWPPG